MRVRTAVVTEIAPLVQIASVSHLDTRYHSDNHFAPGRSDELYEVWIENSCRGFTRTLPCWWPKMNQEHSPVPVTCHRNRAAGEGHIGLFAVSEHVQGRGVGRALLQGALDWFAANGVSMMSVATQLRNLRAVQFYSRRGLS